MLTPLSKKSVSRQGKNLLLVAVALVTLNQNVSVYAGNAPTTVRYVQTNNNSSSISSDVRRLYAELVRRTLVALGQFRP